MTKIQFRRGTASQWTTANPILSAGECGYETDTGLAKIGDGSTTWTALEYITDTLSQNYDGGNASSLFGGSITIDGGAA